jgi:hypothetical protein
MASKHSLVVDQGSDFSLGMNFKIDGVARNLTGYLVRGDIKKTLSSTKAASFTCDVTNDALGQFVVRLSAAVTTSMEPGVYLYDLEIYNGPLVSRVLEGNLTVRPEVTK